MQLSKEGATFVLATLLPNSEATMGRSLDATCTRRANLNVAGNRKSLNYQQHADTRMVKVICWKCLQDSCTKQPSFNVLGSNTAVYCKQHADNGNVDVRNMNCSHNTSTKLANFNVVGTKQPLYCIVLRMA